MICPPGRFSRGWFIWDWVMCLWYSRGPHQEVFSGSSWVNSPGKQLPHSPSEKAKVATGFFPVWLRPLYVPTCTNSDVSDENWVSFWIWGSVRMSSESDSLCLKGSREVFWCSGVPPQGPPGRLTAPALSRAYKDHSVHGAGEDGSRATAPKWQVTDTPQVVTCQNWQKRVCVCEEAETGDGEDGFQKENKDELKLNLNYYYFEPENQPPLLFDAKNRKAHLCSDI